MCKSILVLSYKLLRFGKPGDIALISLKDFEYDAGYKHFHFCFEVNMIYGTLLGHLFEKLVKSLCHTRKCGWIVNIFFSYSKVQVLCVYHTSCGLVTSPRLKLHGKVSKNS